MARTSSWCGIDGPHATKNDEEAADVFYDGDAFGLLVPVEEALNEFSGRARHDDHRTMSDAVGEQQQRAEQQQQHRRGNQVGEFRPNKCAHHSALYKERGRPKIESALPQIEQRAERARAADDDQRHAHRLLCWNSRDIDQHGQGDNRAATAEQSWRKTDQRGQSQSEAEGQ